jgi:hypothetical protein
MIDVYDELIQVQKKKYGDFETMDNNKYKDTKKKVEKKLKKRKYYPPKDDFWEWFTGPAAVKDRYQESIEANKKSRTENKEFSSGFTPRLCNACDRVWDRAIPGRNVKLEYYKDFPTYGMRREDCPPCKRSKNG